jgi:AcrR family transcriptional regulator
MLFLGVYMPPKVKITKEELISASIELVRAEGEQAINARSIAAHIGCSTQPLFSNFATMEQLRAAVVERAEALFDQYVKDEVSTGKYPPYKASGMAYIRFAREEKELFKLLYMRERTQDEVKNGSELFDRSVEQVQSIIGMSAETAKLFHLEIWAFVHGIASMHATGFLSLDEELISKMITDAYRGLKKHYETE